MGGGHFLVGPPVADLKKSKKPPQKNKLTDRAHPVGVCPGGVSRIKGNETNLFFYALLLYIFFGVRG